VLTRQALYHLSHIPSTFSFSLCFTWGLMLVLPEQAADCDSPTSASQVADITSIRHHARPSSRFLTADSSHLVFLSLNILIQKTCMLIATHRIVVGIRWINTCKMPHTLLDRKHVGRRCPLRFLCPVSAIPERRQEYWRQRKVSH
jgi:hypothetical protein